MTPGTTSAGALVPLVPLDPTRWPVLAIPLSPRRQRSSALSRWPGRRPRGRGPGPVGGGGQVPQAS
ncbi:hypothetical protein C6Y14_13535 [Streptomyces dioscori]|uniref:Uncharacterized protein n=1 Tax=Streptomyces dioscori TaxID=2109333 RepID=A0A2P8QA83_9ACTN|nr:hypothetical protein C6Y14_13535 [Streptomyces dioscori]